MPRENTLLLVVLLHSGQLGKLCKKDIKKKMKCVVLDCPIALPLKC